MFFMYARDVEQALSLWSHTHQVFAPREDGDVVHLAPFIPPFGRLACFDRYVNTVMSPKGFVFEEREPLFSWEAHESVRAGGGEKVTVTGAQLALSPVDGGCKEGTLLFGVRPCDAHGFAYMDRFFLGEYQDINYSQRRQRVAVVVLNCTQPGAQCFCASTGTGPFADKGYDLLLTLDRDRLWVEYGTEKGKLLLPAVASLVHSDYEQEGKIRKQALLDEARQRFTRQPDFTLLRAALAQGFDLPLWETLSQQCISCTGCTRVCPTCTCFTTDEERHNAHAGVRVRCWDSCQSEGFTRNAEWHNPRNAASAVRYRVYDKLAYIEDRFGMQGCSGCGRCVSVCPACIDIVDVAETLMDQTKKLVGGGLVGVPAPDDASVDRSGAMGADISEPVRVPYVRVERLFDPQLYTPHETVIVRIDEEAPSIRRFTLRFTQKPNQGRPALRGQFYMLTVFGKGEIAISIPFSDRVRDEFSFYIKKVGKVTGELFELAEGDILGLRGPFGVPLPYESLKGRDLIVIGSGVGHAPVRATLVRAIENKQDFGRIVIIASAMSYQGLILKDDLKAWADVPGVQVLYALSRPTDEVYAHVGYINDLLPDLGLNWRNASAIVCASAKRIKAVARDLLRLGMKPTDIYTALETNMHCGVGKCGHCKVGSHYMCLDGPVFTYAEMLQLPPEF